MCADRNAMEEAWLSKKEPPKNKVGFMYMLAGGTDASNTDPYAAHSKLRLALRTSIQMISSGRGSWYDPLFTGLALGDALKCKLLNKLEKIVIYYQNISHEQISPKINNNFKTNYVSGTSKVYTFTNMPEPKNATEGTIILFKYLMYSILLLLIINNISAFDLLITNRRKRRYLSTIFHFNIIWL